MEASCQRLMPLEILLLLGSINTKKRLLTMCGEKGYRCRVAEDYQKKIDYRGVFQSDVLIVDTCNPSALNMIRDVGEKRHDMPIIVLTQAKGPGVFKATLNLYTKDILFEPIDWNWLGKLLDAHALYKTIRVLMNQYSFDC